MAEPVNVAAVDLGASSGRVVHARLGPDGAQLREVHRFPNTPVAVRGTLHWDVLGLYRGVLDGLRLAHDVDDRLDAVGVDGWAVDYGLLDADGHLLGNPVNYRDERNARAAAATVERLGRETLYAAGGTQYLPFNTVFQLVAERERHLLEHARRALLVPDLVNYWLCGRQATELTNASTTGLLDTRTLDWHRGLAGQAGVDLDLFAPLRRPGSVLGEIGDDVRFAAGLPNGARQVATVPSHDTAAAVAGIPADDEHFAFVATGTWALVGVVVPHPVITDASRAANFTNEVAADGSIRLLRNVTGFWLLQECQREWRAAGLEADAARLVAAAREVPGRRALIDVQDESLQAPGDMPRRIAELAARTGPVPQSPAEFTRCILDSMAAGVQAALTDAAAVSGREPEVVHLVGGGVHNTLFCQLVADATGRPVLAGPGEAAAWGNALWQAVALGAFEPQHARDLVARSEPAARYDPTPVEATAWARR